MIWPKCREACAPSNQDTLSLPTAIVKAFRQSIILVATANALREVSQMTSDNDCQSEEFLWSLGVGASLPSWLQEMRHEQRRRGLNQGPHVDPHSKERLGIGPQVGSGRHAAPRRATSDAVTVPEAEIKDKTVQSSVCT